MAKSVLYMSMSLDGFITGPDDGPGNGLGTGGLRLHEWLGEPVSKHPHFNPRELSGQVFAEVMATGAVVVGRKTCDYAGHWAATTTACRSSCPPAAPCRSRRAAGCTTCPTPRPRCVRPRRPSANRT
jgi:dihydrofolate reductase